MAIEDGLAAAIDGIGASEPPSVSAEQLDMLAEPHNAEAARACVEAAPAKVGAPGIGRRGVGRPKGSRNLNSKAWQEYLLTRYQSPLVGLARLGTANLRDLAHELELWSRDENGEPYQGRDGRPRLYPGALLEVAKLQIVARDKLAPYVHARVPQELQVTQERRGLLVVNLGLPDTEQNQVVMIDGEATSHNGSSHSEQEPRNIKELDDGAD